MLLVQNPLKGNFIGKSKVAYLALFSYSHWCSQTSGRPEQAERSQGGEGDLEQDAQGSPG